MKKKKIKYYPISSGHIFASWDIIHLVNKYNGIEPQKAIQIITTSGKLGGTSPAQDALRLCFDYDLVFIEYDSLSLTEIARNNIVPYCDEDDPNIEVQRAIILHLISFHNFQWLIFYDSDPDIFKNYLIEQDPEWTQILENAKLFNFEEENVILWWNTVLSKYESYKESQKKKIGDIGEKLTYHYELTRIEDDGYDNPRTIVKWASRISDRFGFDVLSIRSNFFCFGKRKTDKIQIEVKSSEISNDKVFRFYISKPEWKKASENIESYFFYCWIGVDLDRETAFDGPFVIPACELVDHIPKDISPICDWSECRCVMDISPFKI